MNNDKEIQSDNAEKSIQQRDLDLTGGEKTQNFSQEPQTKEERYNQEKKIDEALRESFPASDPPAHSNLN